MHCTDDLNDNISAQRLVREAADQGAQVILLPELFESLYFPQLERENCSRWPTRWTTTRS